VKRALSFAGVAVVVGVVAALAGCVNPSTGDFALCCTCLAQKSPVNDGDAVDPSTNCLPDADGDNPGEQEQCDSESADAIADPGGDHPIHVVDELCTSSTCDEECKGAAQFGAKFEVQEQSLSQ
jgi:hypothetical protein